MKTLQFASVMNCRFQPSPTFTVQSSASFVFILFHRFFVVQFLYLNPFFFRLNVAGDLFRSNYFAFLSTNLCSNFPLLMNNQIFDGEAGRVIAFVKFMFRKIQSVGLVHFWYKILKEENFYDL